MYKAMEKKGISPRIKLPTVKEIRALLQFTGPLMTITLTRIGGFFAMQRKAMSLGMQSLAGYQVCIHMMMFFLLFGEPLSQLSQTELPTLLDEGNGVAAWRTLKSVITITSSTALCVASAAFVLARFGTGAFSSDSDVQMIAQSTAPTLFLTIAVAVASVSFDGAQIASKDFSYMLVAGFATFFMQLKLLPYCTSVKQIFATFALRMGIYAMFSVLRTLFGYGGVGRVLYKTSQKMSDSRSPA
jgi:Na+-driven multidrug efflux pump